MAAANFIEALMEIEQHASVRLKPPSVNDGRLSSLCRRIIREEGWDVRKALDTEIEYHRFMELKKNMEDFDAEKLSPSAMIDKCWHHHILDTKRFRKHPFSFLHDS